jgi:type II secretory pathway pseudopilin PulG
MVEVLTVIAIIAILAGILFPVFATVKKNVHKATCTSNLQQISVAMKLYKDDHGVYPTALYGFWSPPVNGGQIREITYLYPQYVKDKSIFRCPLAPFHTTDAATTPYSSVEAPRGFVNRQYPVWDSYDGQFEGPQSKNYVVKYITHWSGRPSGFSDIPKQLIYKNPPDDTVVTWCTYHRDYDSRTAPNANPQTGSIDLVLFLDGHVKPIPSNKMHPITPGESHSYLVGRGD